MVSQKLELAGYERVAYSCELGQLCNLSEVALGYFSANVWDEASYFHDALSALQLVGAIACLRESDLEKRTLRITMI